MLKVLCLLVTFMSFCSNKLNFLRNNCVHKIAFRIKLLSACRVSPCHSLSRCNFLIAFNGRCSEFSILSPKMHLIIIKDIEIYFRRVSNLMGLKLDNVQRWSCDVCKLKVCNYIWRYCSRHWSDGKCNRYFQLSWTFHWLQVHVLVLLMR